MIGSRKLARPLGRAEAAQSKVGPLNGTRAAIDRADVERGHIVALTDNDRRLVIPFDYAADGHLTHGYATHYR